MNFRIYVFKRPDSDNYYLVYRDPRTNRQVRKSAGTNKKREAERLATQWEKELKAGRDWSSGKMTWEEFVDRYTVDELDGKAERTHEKYTGIFKSFEDLVNPHGPKERGRSGRSQ